MIDVNDQQITVQEENLDGKNNTMIEAMTDWHETTYSLGGFVSTYGGIVYLEFDLFGNPYFLVEQKQKVIEQKKLKRRRSPNIGHLELSQIQLFRRSGKTIREISILTGYSIGAVSNALKTDQFTPSNSGT